MIYSKKKKKILVNFCAGWRMTLPASSCVPALVPTTWEESGASALLGWGPLGQLQAGAGRPPPIQEPIHGSSHIISAWNKHSVIKMRQVDTILASPYTLVPALFSWEESGASTLLGLRAGPDSEAGLGFPPTPHKITHGYHLSPIDLKAMHIIWTQPFLPSNPDHNQPPSSPSPMDLLPPPRENIAGKPLQRGVNHVL